MAIKKADTTRASGAPKRLMDNQDTVFKGDSGKSDKVLVTFRAPVELKEALEAFAAERGVSQTAVIVEGVRMRMGLDI